jgi:uncharacterized protein involved in response to NO
MGVGVFRGYRRCAGETPANFWHRFAMLFLSAIVELTPQRI